MCCMLSCKVSEFCGKPIKIVFRTKYDVRNICSSTSLPRYLEFCSILVLVCLFVFKLNLSPYQMVKKSHLMGLIWPTRSKMYSWMAWCFKRQICFSPSQNKKFIENRSRSDDLMLCFFFLRSYHLTILIEIVPLKI